MNHSQSYPKTKTVSQFLCCASYKLKYINQTNSDLINADSKYFELPIFVLLELFQTLDNTPYTFFFFHMSSMHKSHETLFTVFNVSAILLIQDADADADSDADVLKEIRIRNL